MIRYVHIPKELDIKTTVLEFYENWNKPVKRQKKTFKQSRAQKYQNEIVKEAYAE